MRSLPLFVGAAAVVLLLGVIGFLPLFDGPGYESALAAGLLLPFAVAIPATLHLSARPFEPLSALRLGLAYGAALVAIAYATTLLHGLRAGFCDLAGGSAHFALGPAAGALLAGAFASLAAEIARHRKRRRLVAVLVAISVPLASMAISLARFYASPMVFAYDPFVGYFSGTLYDTIVDFSGLITYRAGTAATLLGLFLIANLLRHDDKGRLALRSKPGITTLLFAATTLLASGAMSAYGPRLGHYQTPATIAEKLGAETSGARCTVIHPRTIPADEINRFVRECDAYVKQGEGYFQTQAPPRITAYLFADAAQKGALMGAASTYIAKPWRNEIYVQTAGYPHPVLGHELMHVIAGSFGRGPFRIAGRVGGLIPDPGLIEGVAVAAAPNPGDLSPGEWAKAMKDLGLLPPLSRLFALGFFGENSSTAYTVSGAFVAYIHDRFGPEPLKAWYHGRSLPELTGKSWAELEQDWHAELDTLELPDAAMAQARARFDRPAVFGRRCPHVVDECKVRANALHEGGDMEGAIELYKQILSLDPGDAMSRIAIAKSLASSGKASDALAALEQIAGDDSVPRHVRDRALETLADLDLAQGRGEAAILRYSEIMTRTVNEDRLRTLDVKILAARDPMARPAIVALLIGDPTDGDRDGVAPVRGPDPLLAAELLGAWSTASPQDGLPFYLLARRHLAEGHFELAKDRLDRALTGTLSVPRTLIESERLRMIVACGLGDLSTSERFYQRYAAHPGVTDARRRDARAFVERCAAALPQKSTDARSEGGR